MNAWKARWNALAPRERQGLLLAALVVGLALVWAVLLGPALRTLKGVAAQRAALDQQHSRMLALQAHAQALQGLSAVSPQDALAGLQASAAPLGKAGSLQVLGDQATLTLKQVSAAALAPWLHAQPGQNLNPVEVHVVRDPGNAEASWSGTLVFRLPSKPGGTP